MMILTMPQTGFVRSATARTGEPALTAEIVDFIQARKTRAAEAPLTAAMIWQALQDGRIMNHYQPQVDLITGETVGAEALLRLVDEYGEWVYPDRFIDVAEAHQLIVPLGRAVIESACADLSWCRKQGLPLPRVAINIAAKQLVWDESLALYIRQALNRYDLAHADLELEITERHGLVDESAALVQLTDLADEGTRIVLDDFGIGYSSLHCLQHFPLSAIKLDRSLVSQLPQCDIASTIVQHLLAMAEGLGLDVVAEGIETEDQASCLKQAGCLLGQGYMYAKPDVVEKLLV
jgi:EAL domain-containing protein (putative c-di-GMP-specific phosphodiesterase class I)